MKLFEPITIRGVTIRNRIVMAPVFAGVGLRGRRAINYYVERARGGVGAIIVGATFTDVLGSEEAWGEQID